MRIYIAFFLSKQRIKSSWVYICHIKAYIFFSFNVVLIKAILMYTSGSFILSQGYTFLPTKLLLSRHRFIHLWHCRFQIAAICFTSCWRNFEGTSSNKNKRYFLLWGVKCGKVYPLTARDESKTRWPRMMISTLMSLIWNCHARFT